MSLNFCLVFKSLFSRIAGCGRVYCRFVFRCYIVIAELHCWTVCFFRVCVDFARMSSCEFLSRVIVQVCFDAAFLCDFESCKSSLSLAIAKICVSECCWIAVAVRFECIVVMNALLVQNPRVGILSVLALLLLSCSWFINWVSNYNLVLLSLFGCKYSFLTSCG